jgi:hypothetical protein
VDYTVRMMIAPIIHGSTRPIQRYVEEYDDSMYNPREHQTNAML